MKTIDLKREKTNLDEVMRLAAHEPLLLVTSEGREFVLSEADDFPEEVERLRNSAAFHRFLDERSAVTTTYSLTDIEAAIDAELENGSKANTRP